MGEKTKREGENKERKMKKRRIKGVKISQNLYIALSFTCSAILFVSSSLLA